MGRVLTRRLGCGGGAGEGSRGQDVALMAAGLPA